MNDGPIPKDLLYGELVNGSRPVGRPYLRYKDTCKHDMKMADIDINSWESASNDRDHFKLTVQRGVRRGDEKRNTQLAEKRP